ncbi:hypothetical protein [Couchioplanes caeruleus]|uniref:hypothetical protein n=1 Tax=Couchioplanes caeruleus TaxID=56438 RepID=UPI000B12B5A8|nr:hypothetical protein [Couchioplanes caeruleus]
MLISAEFATANIVMNAKIHSGNAAAPASTTLSSGASPSPSSARLGVDHQQLQQFLTSSTWDVIGVRRRVATAAVQVVARLSVGTRVAGCARRAGDRRSISAEAAIRPGR